MATGKDKFELVIEVNSAQGNAAIKGVNQNLSDLERRAVSSSRGASSGIDRMTASMFKGALGAQALYGAAIKAAQGIKELAKESIGLAMDAIESESLFANSMGKMTNQALKWSKDLSKSLGLNEYELRKNIGTFNVMFTAMGIGAEKAFELSRGLTELAYDMASFYNLRPEEAFDKLRAGITGETEPLKRLGILVDEATAKTYAYKTGIAATGEQLTQQEKVLARYAAITAQTAVAQGDLARTMESPANQLRVLQSITEEAKTTFGMAFLPTLSLVMKELTGFAGKAETVNENLVFMAKVIAAVPMGFYTAVRAVADFRVALLDLDLQLAKKIPLLYPKAYVDSLKEQRMEALKVAIEYNAKMDTLRESVNAVGKFDYDAAKAASLVAQANAEAAAAIDKRATAMDRLMSKQYINADAVRAGAASRAAIGRVDALTTLPGFSGISPEAAQIAIDSQSIANASDEAFVGGWVARRENAALAIQEQNENMIAAQMRRDGNYQGALEIELAQLERLKAGYEGNAEAIAALEEQKKLKIMDVNREIADNAKSEFERSAQTIEGFFNRVFMNARSLSDMWKQLWGQLANYAVQQMARMVAASVGGYRQAAAPAGGGMAAMIPSIFGGGGGGGTASAGGYGGVGTPPFVGGGTGSGMLGMSNLAGYKGFLGMTDKIVPNALGLGQSAIPFSSLSMGGKIGQMASSPAAMMGGAMLGMAGMKQGGPLGMAMTTGGLALSGWAIGAKIGAIGGPWGAAIGAAVGAGLGLIGLFRKSPEEKLKEKIKQAYGVNIRDKGVLQQILSVAQGFGGNLDMAIRHKDVVELISLYAQTTNQTMRGAPKQMSSATLIQSGGSLSMAASYTNGTPTMGSLPGAGIDNVRATGASGGTVINITVPGAKEFFEKETVTVIAKNGRTVSTANASAATGNFWRTQMAATLLKPGLVTS